MLLIAVGEGRTLSGAEELQFQHHVATCQTCRAVAIEPDDEQFRWVARVPEDALDDPDLLVLPTVDPIVFAMDDELAHSGMGRITRDHVVVGGDGGRLEVFDVAQPPRPLDEVMRLVAGSTRWQLVRGRAVERAPGEPPR